MPSKVRKRKVPTNSSELPNSVTRPKPEPNDGGHAALNRHEPTIAPTVFIFLIVGLLLVLPPIFYFTQVMIPDPESTSILSQFRVKGNILLDSLGHTSSSGKGRIPFSPQTHASEVSKEDQMDLKNLESLLPSSPSTPPKLEKEQVITSTKEVKREATISILSSKEELSKKLKEREDQSKIEEELGKFWEASSKYRKEAQNQKLGEYSLRGDGSVAGSNLDIKPKLHDQLSNLADLPPADPDAKEGLTREFWDAIKDQLSADDLTVLLNEMRLKEQSTS